MFSPHLLKPTKAKRGVTTLDQRIFVKKKLKKTKMLAKTVKNTKKKPKQTKITKQQKVKIIGIHHIKNHGIQLII